MKSETHATLHEAITAHVADDNEIVTKWVLVAEVSYPDGLYVATRAGTFDGDAPQLWDGLGLLAAAKHNLDRQMEHCDREWYEGEGDAEDHPPG